MQTALILALFAALFVAWAWFSDKASRFVLGLHDASCPHCKAINTLSVAERNTWDELALPLPADGKGGLLICGQCQKTCLLSEVFPPQTPTSEPPAAA